MGGGLMQLVAYGAQDIYLTGHPQITFFKVVYRRHTNFSMETIEQTINGTPAVSGNSTVTISRNGDLVHKVYVTSDANNITDGSTGLVDEVELEIGGQRIDRHYSEWMNTWNELSTDESKAIGLKSMQGSIGTSDGTTGVGLVQVPLQFWFCRNPGLALPLIALQYHEVKIKVKWGSNGSSSCKVNCDYIYLDTDERRRFAQVSHEYLIEQLQRQSGDGSTSVKLNFNHPVKELIWASAANYGTAKLVLNGHDRFAPQQEEYFQLRQPFDYHSAVPKQNLPSSAQISLLDRQTTFAAPTSIGTLVVEGAAADVAASGSDLHLADGVLNISGTDGNVTVNDFTLGTQLALTIITKGDAGDITGDAGGASAIGDLYFANVTVAAVESTTDVLTMTISTPTSLTGKSFTGAQDAGAGADNTSISVLLVTNGNSAQARTSKMTKKVNVYSFALKPEEHQPSGTCNFSRIDNAKLETTASGSSDKLASSDYIYAVNYNVLRIMSGMGGLAYSN